MQVTQDWGTQLLADKLGEPSSPILSSMDLTEAPKQGQHGQQGSDSFLRAVAQQYAALAGQKQNWNKGGHSAAYLLGKLRKLMQSHPWPRSNKMQDAHRWEHPVLGLWIPENVTQDT